jgi:hypothetical protein
VKLNLNLRAIAVLWDLSDKLLDELLAYIAANQKGSSESREIFIKNE